MKGRKARSKTPRKLRLPDSAMPRRRTKSPVAGLKPVSRRLADGTRALYWYHRATGKRLKHDPNSAAGLVEIRRLDARAAEDNRDSGSLAAIIAAYKAPDATRAGKIRPFRGLKERTRADYQAAFAYVEGEAHNLRPDDMRPRNVQKLVDDAAEAHGWSFGNKLLIALRAVINWGIYHEHASANPCVGVSAPDRPKDRPQGNRRWKAQELAAVWARAPFRLRVAIVLGLYSTLRAQDARVVPVTAYDGARLTLRAQKNGEEIDVIVSGPFKAVLDEAVRQAKARHGERWRETTLLQSAWGRAYSKAGLEQLLARTRDPLVEAGKIGAGLTFHGLRVTLASIAKEGGAADNAIAAAIHDRSPEMARRYSRDAEKALIGDGVRLALIERIGHVFSSRMENGMENEAVNEGGDASENASNVLILEHKSA